MKYLSVILVMIGCILFGIGMSMRSKQNAFTHLEEEIINGNMPQCVATGAGVGGVAGGVAGATIGGIGITLCGTGVGIPAGVVCLGCAALCALIGGSAGAMVGKADKVMTTPVTEMVNAYSPGEYGMVMVLGVALIVTGIILFFRERKLKQNETNTQYLYN